MGGKFSTKLVDEAIKRSGKESEALRRKVIERLFHALAALAGRVEFKEAYIFGSITKEGRFDNNSDIDVGFIGLGDEDVVPAIAFLSGELERDVDVVQLEGHKLAAYIREGIKWKRKD